VLGEIRTLAQDMEFAVDQLVEVAVRALSPGVNDPFTAVTCVDVLGDALRRVATRRPSSPVRRDEDGVPRVVGHPITLASLLDAAFNQLRQYGAGSVAVTIRLLETVAALAAQAGRADDLEALRRHVEEIREHSAASGRDRRGQRATSIISRPPIVRCVVRKGGRATPPRRSETLERGPRPLGSGSFPRMARSARPPSQGP
jgi:uncharacterized membrane protein